MAPSPRGQKPGLKLRPPPGAWSHQPTTWGTRGLHDPRAICPASLKPSRALAPTRPNPLTNPGGAGSGRTGYQPVPPNNYPFYNDDEKYKPIIFADGGQFSGENVAGEPRSPPPSPKGERPRT